MIEGQFDEEGKLLFEINLEAIACSFTTVTRGRLPRRDTATEIYRII